MPDDNEDQKRKAEIEEMMRSQRERYFRDEPLQQEYRDVVTRLENRSTGAATPVRTPGPFDTALARYMERKTGDAGNPPQADVSGSSYLFDGGEAEARSIFRRNDEVPDGLPEALPDAGVVKGDRLVPGRASNAAGLPVTRQDDALKAFEVDTPLWFDGENRVEELQGNQPDRPLPIKLRLEDQINYAAWKNGVGVEVHSSGQVAAGEVGPRLKDSGTRHDHGGAADVDLYVIENGQRRYLDSKNLSDRRIMENFIHDAVVAGVTGVGRGYMRVRAPDGGITTTRRIHVGEGSPVAWRDLYDSKDPRYLPPFPWVEAVRGQGKDARAKMLKSGAWPNPTAPIKSMAPPQTAYDI